MPIAGPANAVTALSAVADESRDRSQLSEALYLDDDRVHTAATGGGTRDITRGALTDTLGHAPAANAAGVVANFEMMNRILDATGVPIPRRRLAILRELGRSPDAD
ncbi:MAG: hypothetical protein KY460_10390 [Actinobacteria bacterium]|nr:hypothetical protein [Actinomycetota bacterium]